MPTGGVDPAPALAIFLAPAFGSRFPQTRSGRLFTQIYKCFQSDSVRMVLELFTKEELSSLAVHNGISLRKSDEDERVPATVMENEMLAGRDVVFSGHAHADTKPTPGMSLSHIHTPWHS